MTSQITVSVPRAATALQMDDLVGHEGTHVGQDQALVASFKPNGTFDKTLNLSTYDAENAAYHTEAKIMQLSGQTQTLNGPAGTYPIASKDNQGQVDQTINQFLADPANGYGVSPQNPGPPIFKKEK